eukprot:TRINITY_DN540_c0_g1_i10.p3 TRINITY_DN540_c0_g1~~TRINITY_DN540_c0_g1_i10.p3  ORF type:complete len:288 (+),score=113.55 TRINITY_DN540_c0_g1_i10:69-932(+)
MKVLAPLVLLQFVAGAAANCSFFQENGCVECCVRPSPQNPDVEFSCTTSCPHDCRTRELWSEEKREWCCKWEALGCRTPTVPSPPAHECTPGSTKKADCNTCFCSPTGVWACTEKACVVLPPAPVVPKCASDADCASDEHCRPAQNPDMFGAGPCLDHGVCAKRSVAGERCSGMLPACFVDRCAEGLVCEAPEDKTQLDAPGTCVKAECQWDSDCTAGQTCAHRAGAAPKCEARPKYGCVLPCGTLKWHGWQGRGEGPNQACNVVKCDDGKVTVLTRASCPDAPCSA